MKFKELEEGSTFRALNQFNEEDSQIWIKQTQDDLNCFVKSNGFGAVCPDEVEVTLLKPFRVAAEWSMCWEGEIYAETLEEAIEQVNSDEGTLINTSTDGSYIDDSFQVNEDVTQELNRCSYCNGTGTSETELYEGLITCPVCKGE